MLGLCTPLSGAAPGTTVGFPLRITSTLESLGNTAMASVLPQKNWLLIYMNTLGDALDYTLNLSSKSRPASTSRTNEQLSPLGLSKYLNWKK